MEIIEAMNAHLGTHFGMNSNWKDIFKEEAAFPEGGNMVLNPEEEWPSDDSEDDDYDPDRRVNNCSISVACTDDNASEDESISTSLSWSLDAEVFSGSGGLDNNDITVDSDGTTDGEIICGRRQRRSVDYKKLYDEMFGKDAPSYELLSEDEEWGPAKRRRRKESDAASTLMTLYESEKKSPNEENVHVKKKKLSPDQQIRRSFFRIPPDAVENLRQVFAENELPSRAVRDNLSKELGIHLEKVSKWFKNARYVALKSRKGQMSVLNDEDDDVCLIKLLKARNKETKMIKAEVAFKAVEMEMERLCGMKKRVENMKKTLSRLQRRKTKGNEPKQTIIYVPVAQLKEKVATT